VPLWSMESRRSNTRGSWSACCAGGQLGCITRALAVGGASARSMVLPMKENNCEAFEGLALPLTTVGAPERLAVGTLHFTSSLLSCRRRRGIFWPAVKVEFNGSISSKDTFDTIRTARMTWAGLTAGGGGTIPRTTGARRGGTARRKRARRSRDSSPEDGGGAGRPWAPPLGIRSRDEQGHSSYEAMDGSAVLQESVGALKRPAVGTLLLTTG